MNEEQARIELQKLLDWLYKTHINYSEANLNTSNGKQGFVEFNISRMYREFEGNWDEARAAQYITSLELELKTK